MTTNACAASCLGSDRVATAPSAGRAAVGRTPPRTSSSEVRSRATTTPGPAAPDRARTRGDAQGRHAFAGRDRLRSWPRYRWPAGSRRPTAPGTTATQSMLRRSARSPGRRRGGLSPSRVPRAPWGSVPGGGTRPLSAAGFRAWAGEGFAASAGRGRSWPPRPRPGRHVAVTGAECGARVTPGFVSELNVLGRSVRQSRYDIKRGQGVRYESDRHDRYERPKAREIPRVARVQLETLGMCHGRDHEVCDPRTVRPS